MSGKNRDRKRQMVKNNWKNQKKRKVERDGKMERERGRQRGLTVDLL